jgi:hypothetical protein
VLAASLRIRGNRRDDLAGLRIRSEITVSLAFHCRVGCLRLQERHPTRTHWHCPLICLGKRDAPGGWSRSVSAQLRSGMLISQYARQPALGARLGLFRLVALPAQLLGADACWRAPNRLGALRPCMLLAHQNHLAQFRSRFSRSLRPLVSAPGWSAVRQVLDVRGVKAATRQVSQPFGFDTKSSGCRPKLGPSLGTQDGVSKSTLGKNALTHLADAALGEHDIPPWSRLPLGKAIAPTTVIEDNYGLRLRSA